MSLVEAKAASFSYGSQEIFKNINFQVNKGEIFCVIGPNGCGKTTLLDCLLGILRLNSGDILVGGKSVGRISPGELARSVAYVPQSHQKTFPYKVIDIVIMGRAPYTGFFESPSLEDIGIAEDALERVGMARFKDRPYTQLSGGEVQLVMIARALAQKTPVIIMDEPSAHLDFKHELVILETIVQLVHETGLSVVMATHFPNHAFYFENNNIVTNVALMNGMIFSEVGAPSTVLTEENLKKLYNINAAVVACRINGDTDMKQIIPISTVA